MTLSNAVCCVIKMRIAHVSIVQWCCLLYLHNSSNHISQKYKCCSTNCWFSPSSFNNILYLIKFQKSAIKSEDKCYKNFMVAIRVSIASLYQQVKLRSPGSIFSAWIFFFSNRICILVRQNFCYSFKNSLIIIIKYLRYESIIWT